MAKKREWWHKFFVDFKPLFGIVPRKTSNAQARFIISKLNLKPGRSFLDCPCGVGRISLPLAKKGIRVTAVDIMPSYLDECRKKARNRGLKVDLLHRDMRRISYKNRFDAAGNLWTSFGFFEKESDNRLVLRRMYDALKPGGRFMLHVINRDWVVANYQPQGWFEVGTLKVLEKRVFDYARSMNHSTWYFIKDGKESVHEFSLRLYSYHELRALLHSVGFRDIEGWGGIDERAIASKERMMFIVGTKPKQSSGSSPR